MKLWIGFLLLIIGGILALTDYAPIIGGIAIAGGIGVLLLASAKRNDTDDIDRDALIRG
jgi:hypothetical protein